jgi:hypothetical protein
VGKVTAELLLETDLLKGYVFKSFKIHPNHCNVDIVDFE